MTPELESSVESRVIGNELTCENTCDCVRNHRPELDLVGIFRKPKFFDDGGQLE